MNDNQPDAQRENALISSQDDVTRRCFLTLLGSAAIASLTGACHSDSGSIISVPQGQSVARFPEKCELIMLTDRPPLLETPLLYFRQDITPNEALFVRWHFAGIPTVVDLRTFTLNVGGHVEKPVSFSVADLKKQFEPVSIVAVNQCSGNSRSYFEPQVLGGQWRHGAMGNARWTGVRMKDVLQRAKVKAGAVEVALSGLDVPILSSMPKFEKALDIEHALSDEVLIAYEMNGTDLPMLNGFPLRLVVPGWYATYWVKSLHSINVLPDKFKGFWMATAYRIPKNPDAVETPENLATDTVPINRMTLRSIIVRPDFTDIVRARTTQEIEGIAFDNGSEITKVEVSYNNGASWDEAKLDDSQLGKFSFRRWRRKWTPELPGTYQLMSRATNAAGEIQRDYHQWNKSGYMRNSVERTEVVVV
jgi:DMSO/TMAO reductase YedYZ molybdopterin-dependent catalytic subunit